MLYDVLVIGLGAVGSAALSSAARRGARCVGLDRFDPPHVLGSSHGETRITREATAEGPAYVPLVRRSNALWRDLEAWSGETLLLRTGALIVGDERADDLDFAARTIRVAQQFDVRHEQLSARDVARRFPAFTLSEHEHAYFEPHAGALLPERCIAAHLRRARADGAEIRANTPALTLEAAGDRVRVRTAGETLEAASVVLSAGAWTSDLLGEAFAERARVYRQVLCWFEPSRPDVFDAAHAPVFIWQHGEGDAHFYGFPEVTRGGGVKVATEQLSVTSTPDTVRRDVRPDEATDLFERHLAGRVNALSPRLLRAETCLYTATPDGGFLVDAAPFSPRVTVVSACSGHGFKHSPAVGEAAALRALGEPPAVNLAAFEWSARPSYAP
ncbi:N-methyl-L-tryptophan oxidase [Deinococcus yavapaiensis]|uniref:Monomeric sarcosine oxidase n=1 Tax=Deinococcus yavapaiensis KR-236 TaxID=694435 RepID=A0A318SGW7_9DEIO|nr:N-methyl-L-tryptophan oxidase [Deinococcus yavapaiensis]PYE53248.1 monomeric sarcosine oxidase [Deinococcus yavapaiensis KR-236]